MAIPTLAPNCTWFTQGGTTVTRASITRIDIVDRYTPTGREAASWDASAAKNGGVMCYVNGTVLTIAGNGSGKIYLNTDSSDLFADSKKLDYFNNVIAINGGDLLDTSGDTSLYRSFNYCEKLIELPILPKKNITNLQAAFQNCYAMTTVHCADWDTSKVTTIANVFRNCYALKNIDVSGWNVSNATTMAGAFYACRSIVSLDLTKWMPSKCTNINDMFNSNGMDTPMALRDIGNLNGWDVSKVTLARYTFQGCANLQSLSVRSWVVNSITSMNSIFRGCASLKSLDLSGWNNASCTDTGLMFDTMPSLKKIAVGANFDFKGAVLPTPSSGSWYSLTTGTGYAPADVQSKVADIYVAFSPAILAANSTWFDKCNGAVTRASIETITIVDEHTPSGGEISWDASVQNNGSVMCYAKDGVLIVAGNGTGQVYANADSSYVFCDINKADYFTTLTVINGGNLLDTCNAQTMRNMFQLCGALTYVDVSTWDTSKNVTCQNMFDRCTSLNSLDVRNWRTESTTLMNAMFQGCVSLESLDLGRWDVSNVQKMSNMFMTMENIGLMKLKTIGNVSKWDVRKVETFTAMFQNCANIGSLDLSGWNNTASCTAMNGMFNGMVRLRKIKLGANFSFTGNGSSVLTTLPTPSADYIKGADGKWYNENKTAYAPSAVPNKTAGTYYASPAMLDGASAGKSHLLHKMFSRPAAHALTGRAIG